jgi:hypothetical protein
MIGQKRTRGGKSQSLNQNKYKSLKENTEKNLKIENEIYSSKKPLWISEVKNALKLFPSSINELEFEKIDDMMNQDIDESIINSERYPFFNTIKKMIYSFGDVKELNKLTIIKISEFIKEYISLIIKIIQECEFKKIMELLYKDEKIKFESIKKFRHKSNYFNYDNIKENSFFEKDNKKNNDDEENNEDNENDDMEDSLKDLMIFDEGEEESKNKSEFDLKNLIPISNINNNIINNNNKIDELNKEIALFQDKRTEIMDQKTYEEYIKCRQVNLLSRGKKFFINYIFNIFPNEDKFPNELKETSNIELIAFILNEAIKKIIINSIKEKNPNKKLFILTQPLSPEDIENNIKKELFVLSNFFEKFHNDINMINEFRKKKINNKIYNKYTKVKTGKNGQILLVIKKYIFIKDSEEAEFLSKNKQNSEVQVINGILKLREQIIKITNQKKNNRDGLRKENKKYIIGIKDMIDYIGVENYYEYFLCKDYVRDIDLDKIKINELNGYISSLNKINKKKICNKFEQWLNLTPDEKKEIKNEFDTLFSKYK